MSELARNRDDSSLGYRRIRAPQEHAATQHLPDAAEWRQLWDSNLERVAAEGYFQHCELSDLRKNGREQITTAALRFTSRYRHVDSLKNHNADAIVMSGHQPALFHAGVWYKNFVISQIGKTANALAINLIVDNDICIAPTALIPARVDDSERFVFGRLDYDSNSSVAAFEVRGIQDKQIFSTFGERGCRKISEFSASPILKRLWPHVLSVADDGNLGLAIAKGRHKLEEEIGLNTLELPISSLAGTPAFTTLTREIFTRIAEFLEVYNAVAREYRLLNKIRSKTRPVPDLDQDQDWLETPFWVWNAASPVRRTLFVKLEGNQIVISDRHGIQTSVDRDCSNEEFHAELTTSLCVRPKALITTLFARLICSDLFVHGIGGAKYDQLTNEICRRFFRVKLPDYLTVSGTFLIQKQRPRISPTEIGALRNQIRRLDFHPERFVEAPNDEASLIIEQKKDWLRQDLPLGHRRLRHEGIENCNEQLQSYVSDTRFQLTSRLAKLQELLPTSQVLNSREFSFCFHDDSLTDLLIDLAANHFS